MTDTSPPLDAEAVAAYLRQHPEFFVDHDELITELRIPHQPGAAVSLVERQVRLLRERNLELRQRLTHLMEVARDNDRLFEKTRRLILAMLDAGSLEEVVSVVEDSLRHEFKVPFVSLVLFSEEANGVGRSVAAGEAHKVIGGLLADGKTTCGALRPRELEFLFNEAESGQVGSAAVVSLSHQGLHGILAIGSPDPQHYKSSLGTLFLGYVADVLSRVLARLAAQRSPQ
ncbi:DUF484 family protein [Pseudomonas sp. LRF_L74]|uniref:DUF484 family protein n=1 Tax=Pseudomonas sp. LRF_L74 TaxID=3369422 RepID=UPI003F62E290